MALSIWPESCIRFVIPDLTRNPVCMGKQCALLNAGIRYDMGMSVARKRNDRQPRKTGQFWFPQLL